MQTSDFLKVFKDKYFDELNSCENRDRGSGFFAIFSELFLSKQEDFRIIETGAMRPGYTMSGDGCSTRLFDLLINMCGGELVSIDIDTDTVSYANKNTSNKTSVYCLDSVDFLWNNIDVVSRADLIYLDSFDVIFHQPVLANLHHMKELCCIAPVVKSGAIIAIDDCKFEIGDKRVPTGVDYREVGKGVFVDTFMENIGAKRIYDGYQSVWQIN